MFAPSEIAGDEESVVTVTSVAPSTVSVPKTALLPLFVMLTLPEQVISAELHIVGAFIPETVTSTALLTVSFPFIAMPSSLVISTLPVQVISALPVIAG